MARKKFCGVYSLINIVNGKRYIGQSVDIQARNWYHTSDLRYNKHHNKHLQKDFNEYGEDNFEHEILEFCEEDMLHEKESFWIKHFDSMNPKNGYNLQSGGLKDMKFSDEVKKKISLKTRGINNPNGILTDDDLDYIINCVKNGKIIEDIANDLGVSKSPIALFIQNRSHKYFKPEIREDLKNIYKIRQENRYKECFDLYVKHGYSQNEACKKTGVSRNTLRKLLKENGVDTKIHINQVKKKNIKHVNTEVTYESKTS